MNTKEMIAAILEDNDGTFVSGNEIADRLGITRAAVWKGIKGLEEDGYQIDAVRNRGYRLGERNDVVSEISLKRYLGEYSDIFRVKTYQSVTSTNDILKEEADHLMCWQCAVSNAQTRGKGRRTRSFYSPKDTGLYLSMLIKLPLAAMEATRLTTASAIAACRAIEQCTGEHPQIKWVNDVYLRDRKICGILTEASISMESQTLEWAVMGIGFNVYDPEGGFPDEIAQIAGSISGERKKDLRSMLAAQFMKEYYGLCQDLNSSSMVEEYRQRSLMQGRNIAVLKGEMKIPARVIGIDDNLELIVEYEDGTREALSSGEVSIRL